METMDQAALEKSFSPFSCTKRFATAEEAYKAHYTFIETGKHTHEPIFINRKY